MKKLALFTAVLSLVSVSIFAGDKKDKEVPAKKDAAPGKDVAPAKKDAPAKDAPAKDVPAKKEAKAK